MLPFAGLVIVAALSACKDPNLSASQRMREKQEAKFVPAKSVEEGVNDSDADRNELGRIQKPLPVEKILKDNQGRDLDAQIIGKDKTHLTVVRKADGERFDLAIASLSEADQDFVAGLLDQAPPKPEPEEEKIDPEVERWTKELKSLDEEINEANEAMNDPGLGGNSPRRKGLEKEVKRLQEEKKEVETWLRKASSRVRANSK